MKIKKLISDEKKAKKYYKKLLAEKRIVSFLSIVEEKFADLLRREILPQEMEQLIDLLPDKQFAKELKLALEKCKKSQPEEVYWLYLSLYRTLKQRERIRNLNLDN